MAGTKKEDGASGEADAGQKARAARLRQQIGWTRAGKPPAPPRSPRDFIDEKMRGETPAPVKPPKATAKPRAKARAKKAARTKKTARTSRR
jgi:hypothetical protein